MVDRTRAATCVGAAADAVVAWEHLGDKTPDLSKVQSMLAGLYSCACVSMMTSNYVHKVVYDQTIDVQAQCTSATVAVASLQEQ